MNRKHLHRQGSQILISSHPNVTQQRLRRIRSFWVLLALLLLFALPRTLQAQFTYTIENGTVTITGYTAPSTW